MSWFDYLRSFGTRREKLKERVVTSDPTAGLPAHAPQFFGSELLVNQLPPYHLAHGRLMLRSDPLVQFALNVRNAALMVAEVEITAKEPVVQQWVEKQWDVLWNKHRNKILATKAWGFGPLQIVFKAGPGGLIEIEDVKDFAPERTRAEECGGKVCGFKIQDRKLRFPQGLWLTFNSEYGSPYGTGCLRRQYPAWFEKWTNHGAKKLLQLRMLKDAYIGDIFWYPKDQLVQIPDGFGGVKTMPWRDLVRELGENRLSGAAQFLPSVYDDKNNKLLDYTPPQDVPGGSQIFEWNEQCDEGILRGADVPVEVVKASETGSGYSGRSIPFMVVLSVCTGELTEYIQCIEQQVLRPAAWLNWGGDPQFEIKPKSLVESFAQDASGSPLGGAAIGGQPGQRPERPSPPSQPGMRMGWVGHDGQVTQFDEDSDRWITIGGPTHELAEIEVPARKLVQDAEGVAPTTQAGTHVSISDLLRGAKNQKGEPLIPEAPTQFDEADPVAEDVATTGSRSARQRIRRAASRIRALKKNALTPLTELAQIVEGELLALHRGLSADLAASMLGGHLVGAAEGWTSLPAAFAPPPTVSSLPPAPPAGPPSLADMLGPDEPPPAVSFPVVEDALDVLAEAPVAVQPDYRATAEAVKQGAFAITGDLTEAAVADVRDILVENLVKGPDRESFIEAVIERLGEGGPLSEARVETIFRTNVATAISDGTEKALKNPIVADAFPYRAYYSTTDNRVRKEHRALEKHGLDGTNIYRADDPVWAMFRPPWAFNCRCAWSPVSVEQAARRGVREAQEWLERAKAMAAELGGSEYQYFERTAPASPAWVAPPPFQPDPEFQRQ
jgi:SPP1 gp7 family putative phage head morphogenesis protein